MKLSEISMEALMALPYEQMWNISSSGIRDDGEWAEFALLLGSKPERAVERALAAAQLYREGRVNWIIPSGGVLWECRGEMMSEAELMARVLRKEGVPDEAIVLENEARTTRQNMRYGAAIISFRNQKTVEGVIIVTSVLHMKRSLALARAAFPKETRISAYPSYPKLGRDEWIMMEENQRHLRDGLRLLKELVDRGEAEDMELM